MTANSTHLATLSQTLADLPNIDSVLREPLRFCRNLTECTDFRALVVWEEDKNRDQVCRFARQNGLKTIRTAEGFLPKLGPTPHEPPCSLVIDDSGIYYDATRASALETLIASSFSEECLTRARQIIAAWQNQRISKHHFARDFPGDLPPRFVVVFDQCRNDPSLAGGFADASSFDDMLRAAVEENPGCTLIVHSPMEAVNGDQTGFFERRDLNKLPDVFFPDKAIHPARLLEKAERVYCVTSILGFEALLWGKTVRTFGMPFFAGWGLTSDELQPPARRRPVVLEQLVYAVLIAYSRYLDPQTGLPCEIEDLLNWIGLQRKCWERFPRELYAYGFNKFKRQFIHGFFQGSKVHYVKRLSNVPQGSTVLVWGSHGLDPSGEKLPDVDVLRLEDGFLRSVGLGAEFRVRPLSWAADSRSIYFDATRVSDLEYLLQTTEFTDELLLRAKNLRERIVKHNLTKYNFGVRSENLPSHDQLSTRAATRPVILVPGQVEKDASIKFGAPGIRQNMALLREARKNRPEAYLIYKPHPDVYSGLRHKGDNEDQAGQWCDEIVTDRAMGDLLTEVDEVHVLTSLAGFEALLREKKVTCYGQPFYAGWGLTTDSVPLPGRTRRLSIDELVAAALILYPLYLSSNGNRLIGPEQAIDELLNWRTKQAMQRTTYYQKFRQFIHKHIKKK